MQAFNTSVASAVTGASERQLRYWDKVGVVKPSVAQAAGRGSRRLYAFLDLVQGRAAKRLRDEGLSLQKLRKALALLKEKPEKVRHPLAELRLITDGKDVFRLTEDPRVLQDLLKQRQFVHVFAIYIKPVCDDVNAELRRTTKPERHDVLVNGVKHRVFIEPDFVDGGFVAECRRLRGCVTTGETKEAALSHARDAIVDWLAAGRESRLAQAQ